MKPPTSAALLEKAQQHLQAGRFADAASLYRIVLQRDPGLVADGREQLRAPLDPAEHLSLHHPGRRSHGQESEARAEGRTLPAREGVSLRQRAWPLVDLMKRAHPADHDIVWGA